MAEETNDVEILPNVKNNNYLDSANLLRAKHQDIRDNFDRLERVSAKGPNSQEFIEPKVQGLWRIASNSNFTADELASLKVELLHYESRLLKLRHLHAEHALNREKYKVMVFDCIFAHNLTIIFFFFRHRKPIMVQNKINTPAWTIILRSNREKLKSSKST